MADEEHGDLSGLPGDPQTQYPLNTKCLNCGRMWHNDGVRRVADTLRCLQCGADQNYWERAPDGIDFRSQFSGDPRPMTDSDNFAIQSVTMKHKCPACNGHGGHFQGDEISPSLPCENCKGSGDNPNVQWFDSKDERDALAITIQQTGKQVGVYDDDKHGKPWSYGLWVREGGES